MPDTLTPAAYLDGSRALHASLCQWPGEEADGTLLALE